MIHRRLSPVHAVALHSHHCRADGDVGAGCLETVLNSASSLLRDTWNPRHNTDSAVPLSPELQGGDLRAPRQSGATVAGQPIQGAHRAHSCVTCHSRPLGFIHAVCSRLCALRSSFIKQIGSYFERLETEKNKSLPNPSEMTAFTYGSKWLYQDSSSSLQHGFSGLPLGAPCVRACFTLPRWILMLK